MTTTREYVSIHQVVQSFSAHRPSQLLTANADLNIQKLSELWWAVPCRIAAKSEEVQRIWRWQHPERIKRVNKCSSIRNQRRRNRTLNKQLRCVEVV